MIGGRSDVFEACLEKFDPIKVRGIMEQTLAVVLVEGGMLEFC